MFGPVTTDTTDHPFVPPAVSQLELHCTDLTVAEAFYCHGLGFGLIGKVDDALLVDAGNVSLLITRVTNPRRGTTLYLNADDRIHQIAHTLAARGIYFTQPPRCVVRDHFGRDVWIGYFNDPSGNPLALLGKMPSR